MKKLTPKEERDEQLLKFGIPKLFLKNIGKIDELDYSLQYPEGAYYYFPKITNYTIFTDVTVTPIFDCGETFYALFEKDNVVEIVKFELENDEIYTNYGLNWNVLLMDVLWDYFDLAIEEDNSLKLFCAVGEKIGFLYTEKLFKQLDITGDEISKKMQDQKNWKKEVAKNLHITMTENKKFIFESIFNQVRMGLLSIAEIKDNIIEEIEDNQFEEEISEAWAFTTIEQEHTKLQLESKHWSSPTDTEKLIAAFDELCSNNIIALHNAGYTTSDGEDEVVDVEKQLRKHQITSNGYCFYHEQDLSRAISTKNSSLYIAFQKVNNSDPKITLSVGKKVVQVLTEKGFTVDWKNDVNSKILIKNFKWQHVFNENKRNLQDYNQIIELFLKNKVHSTENKSFWYALKNLFK